MSKSQKISTNFDDIPLMLEPTAQMNKANAPIEIYKGIFILKYKSTQLEINGGLQFEWFPNSGVYFYGEFISNSIIDHFNPSPYTVIVKNEKIGNGFLISSTLGGVDKKSKIKGLLIDQSIFGDISIPVDEVRFSIPNLRDFYGEPSKKVFEKNTTAYRNRLTLSNENFSFILDKHWDFKRLKESVKSNGGFIVNYSGQLKSKKGESFKKIEMVLNCFNRFLWFLNGRRTSALFIQGIHNGEIKWQDFTSYHVDTFKYVNTWPPNFSIKDFDQLWINFTEFWKNPNDQDFLKTLLHWYVESNGNSGMAEGAVIMGQTALELVYNWWIIENKKMITGKDSESLNASNKIRLILSQLNINPEVPASLKLLSKYSKKPKIDGPEAIVQIRNAIVHSQGEKRSKLNKIDSHAIYEASQLLLLYLELSLLRILDYKGSFLNRCNGKEEKVPWVNQETSPLT